MSEPASEGAGYCNRGDHQEDGHKHSNRVAGAIKTSAGDFGDICDKAAGVAEWSYKSKKSFDLKTLDRSPQRRRGKQILGSNRSRFMSTLMAAFRQLGGFY
jgi:hypothetical protein